MAARDDYNDLKFRHAFLAELLFIDLCIIHLFSLRIPHILRHMCSINLEKEIFDTAGGGNSESKYTRNFRH